MAINDQKGFGIVVLMIYFLYDIKYKYKKYINKKNKIYYCISQGQFLVLGLGSSNQEIPTRG